MSLLLPMGTLILLTFIVMVIMVVSRVLAVRNKTVKAGYFKIKQNKSDQEIPTHIIQIGKNFSNLMEMPPLFYITCIVYMQLNQVDMLVIILAWLFVIFRIVHSIIHLSSNHLIARMLSFFISCMTLLIMWVNIIGINFL